MKKIARSIFYLFPKVCQQYILFIYFVHYWPNFKKPKTFNEKIHFRKFYWKNQLMVKCSNKITAKEYARNKLGNDFIIENYFTGDSISFEIVKNIIERKGGIALKASHNSGPVFLLDEYSSDDRISKAVKSIMNQLKDNYGLRKQESWYSESPAQVLVEKRLYPKTNESSLRDYKFHVFNQGKDEKPIVIVQVNFDLFGNPNQSFFDENLNYLPFSNRRPSIVTKIEYFEAYPEMLAAAKKLAAQFTYVRCDFYQHEGQVYFGEMTFANESGRGRFTDKMYDLWMGSLWKGDPRY